MGGALRKTMVYLGLAEDDERYEAWDVEDEAGGEAEDDGTEEPYTEQRRPEPREQERRAAVTPIGRAHIARDVPQPAGSRRSTPARTTRPRRSGRPSAPERPSS
jgi:cell division inhibitor SepF